MSNLSLADSMSKVSVHSFKTKGGKSKRMRTSFTNEQLSRLEKEFARQQYMVGSERFVLASALQLTEAQVINKATTKESMRKPQLNDLKLMYRTIHDYKPNKPSSFF